jgi:hypothetical protein
VDDNVLHASNLGCGSHVELYCCSRSGNISADYHK